MSTEAGAGRGNSAANSWTRKTVLLVDVDARSREARSQVLRTLGAEVHSAASAPEARLQLHSGSYSIVLLDFGGDRAGAEKFAAEIRSHKPRQLVALLVGSPQFIAKPFPRKSEPQAAAAAPSPGGGALLPSDFGERIRAAEAAQTAAEEEEDQKRR